MTTEPDINNSAVAIKVEHLTKSFKIPLERSSGLKQKLINTIKGRKGHREFTPLNDISFEIKKGEFFGIVGRNGSGKSTLLKSMAGIYTTESGKVTVDGKIVPFIELGVGFNAELSGRENVFLNGALLGFSNKEIEAMYDEIVDFAELHDFMEERLKNYSSGMQVRLAFSIAIRAKGDILLLDEVLAVGDAAFQQKCFRYFEEIKRSDKTVILVTHSMSSVKQYCTRALYLKDGEIAMIGSPEDIAQLYELENFKTASGSSTASGNSRKNDTITSDRVPSFDATIVDKKEKYSRGDIVSIEMKYEIANNDNVIAKIALIKDGVAVAHINSLYTYESNQQKGNQVVKFNLKTDDLINGIYTFTCGIFDAETHEKVSMKHNADSFFIQDNDETRSGGFRLEGEWIHEVSE